MSLISAPTITTSINQNFFIEALTGAQNPISYLDRFPDAVYTKAIDSLLVQFLYALLGPVGVGGLKQEYLEARLQLEMANLSGSDIDTLYTNAFAIARLADETYQLDADSSLLPAAQRAQILQQDASFRNRSIDFLKGARAGGTKLGITMVARSGLNRPVEVIENYQALFDRFSDEPLNLPYFGHTLSTNEAIVIPRQITPQSAVQTLTITGTPVKGWFSLTYADGQNWQLVPVTTTLGSNVLTVSNATQFPAGTFVTLTNLPSTATTGLNPAASSWNNATLFAESAGSSPGTVTLIYPPSAGALAGQAAPAPSTGNFLALVGWAQTLLLPFNATAPMIQNALTALPLIGTANVIVTGGPLPAAPIQIQFAGQLSDQPVALIVPNTAPDKVTGVTATGSGGTEEMSDINSSPFTVIATITQSTAGISVDSQRTTIAPGDEYAMRQAVSQIQPLTTLITTQEGQPETVRQPITDGFIASSRAEVVRYVTGRASVSWPPIDATHWIQGGTEHEGPRALNDSQQHYQGFHNVASVISYTEAALSDPTYGVTPAGLISPYWDSLIGLFSARQRLLVAGLSSFTDPTAQYTPMNALAPTPEPLILTSPLTASTAFTLNDIYPIDYYSLPGVTPPTNNTMWASSERTEGTDYLEIDLGSVQAVNFLYFEASRTPYTIDVAYDTLDQSPARSFLPVTIAPSTVGQSITTLTYEAAAISMWEACQIYFTNVYGGMIYTRFLRIGFTRDPFNTPYFNSAATPPATIPYSVEVRNLRVGRNVSTPDGGVTLVASGASAGSEVSIVSAPLYPDDHLFPDDNLFPSG